MLDQYLVEYNTKRPYRGRGMNGRTPTKAFIDGIRQEDTPQPKPEGRLTFARQGGDRQPITLSVQSAISRSAYIAGV